MDGGSTEDAGGGSLEDLGGLERWRTNSGIAIWSLVHVGSFLLNITLLLAFLRRSGLRTISNRFVMNLTASNLLTCIVFNSLMVMDNLSSYRNWSFCAISEGATALVTTSSVLSVLLIAIDQYFAVVDPLRYRTRIDKLKCGILILSVWFIAIVFGTISALNPSPRSIWGVCSNEERSLMKNASCEDSIIFNTNASNEDIVIRETELSFDESLELLENTTNILSEALFGNYDETNETTSGNGTLFNYITYGLVYAVAYALFVYLLPFIGVCWIYITIYYAARKNSQRTRRTGSRPILPSGSFCEEYYPVRQDIVSYEDFRRIPKISSLSSIDENSETTPSQIARSKSTEHIPSSSSLIDKPNSAVIFTVGTTKVEVASQELKPALTDDAKESNVPKVPIAALKAKFLLSAAGNVTLGDNLVKSKFPEISAQRRKSSHDLMYEEMMLNKDLNLGGFHLGASSDESSEDEPEDEESLSLARSEGLRQFPNSKNQYVVDGVFTANNGLPILSGPTIHESPLQQIPRHNTTSCPDVSDCGAIRTCTIANPPNTPIVTITPPHKTTLHRASSVKSTSSYINSLKHRISNGSLFKYREETRAARISALVIVMGLICWTPYVVDMVLLNLPLNNCEAFSSKGLDTIALSLFVLATYVSPLLFGYRSKRVKRELRKFFCFRKELSYKNNRSLMAKKVLKRRHSNTLGHLETDGRYNIFNCVYGRNRWPKEKVHFMQMPEPALAVETCRSSFSSGASTQISSTSTDEC